MAEHIPDLAFEFIDVGGVSTIRLEQRDYCGEPYLIDLHPSQLRLIAERAGLLVTGSEGTAARRLRVVSKKLFDLAAAEYYRGEIMERCGLGGEFLTELDGIRDLAGEFLHDLAPDVVKPPPDMILQRRLERILDDADELFQFLASVLSFPPSEEEPEDVTRARRLVEAIEDLLSDHFAALSKTCGSTGNEQSASPETRTCETGAQTPSNEKSTIGISVTSDAPKRGRPPTGTALTNAERQKRHRDKQADQAAFDLAAA